MRCSVLIVDGQPTWKPLYTDKQGDLKVQRVDIVNGLIVNSFGLQFISINTLWNAMLHTVHTIIDFSLDSSVLLDKRYSSIASDQMLNFKHQKEHSARRLWL